MSAAETVNLWSDAEHARAYLEGRFEGTSDNPWRESGYDAVMAWIPSSARRVLDLGCGDGEVGARILGLVPEATVLAVDFSDEMLRRATERFENDDRVEVCRHDLDDPLPDEWGTFDLVVSAFAIHHVVDERKLVLYGEVFDHLVPGGSFFNLEHVASPTRELHAAFLEAVGKSIAEDDPSNKLAPVETQLGWFRDLGFTQVDCHYKWREIALLAGQRP